MPPSREEAIHAEHRRAIRACTTWAVAVPAATLPLALMSPIVGVPLFTLAALLAVQTHRRVARPFAYGAYHWRLAAEAFREATRAALVAGTLAVVATAILKAIPQSAAAAVAAVAMAVALVFSTAYSLGSPREVAFDHVVAVLLERPAWGRTRYETGLVLMKRAEDVDGRAIALLGEPLIGPRIESMPPFDAAFDGPEADDPLDRIGPLTDSFEAEPDAELAEALRDLASVVEAARADGIRRRLVAVPPYPCAQALDMMGSTRRYG